MSPRCRSCGAEIIWALTEGLNWIPVDSEPALMGNLILDYATSPGPPPLARHVTLENAHTEEAEVRFVSHFATCPESKEWRRG